MPWRVSTLAQMPNGAMLIGRSSSTTPTPKSDDGVARVGFTPVSSKAARAQHSRATAAARVDPPPPQ